MNILFCQWGSVCEIGLSQTIEKSEHTLLSFKEECKDFEYDTAYMTKLSEFVGKSQRPDCILSINFIPIISRMCNLLKIPYISWTVDSPCLTLYSETIANSCNYIFIFDRILAEKFEPYNPSHVFHLPLGCNTDTLDLPLEQEHHKKFDCDVSFIGSLYTEKCAYDELASRLPDYMQGYIEGMLSAQLNVFGYNFIEEALSEDMAKDFQKYADFVYPPDHHQDPRGIMADHFLNRKCSALERPMTMAAVGEHFAVDLYTTSDTKDLPQVKNRGIADSTWMMPRIFKCSKVNLNISLRSIKSGVPQRVFDVLGAGGFLITNYQPEIAELFVDGEDLVMYESIPDLIAKIDYYLNHEDERLAIAKHGQETVKEHHNYDGRLELLLMPICG